VTYVPDPLRSRAVLIGVSTYLEKSPDWPDLPAVRQNLIDLKRVLCDPDHWGLPPDHCEVVPDPTDASTTLEAVADAAEQASDLLLVYYTGHGAGTESELFLTMASVSTRRLGTRSIRYSALSEEIRRRRAAYAVVLLDCCFSGRATAMSGAEAFLDAQISPTAAYVLASSARNQISLAPKGQPHTAFTGTLLDIVDGGMAPGPERLTFETLRQEMERRLDARRMPVPHFKQSDKGDLLAVFRNRRWRPPEPAAPAPALSTPELGPPDDSIAHGVALVTMAIRRVYGPTGTAVRAVDRTGAVVWCADAVAAAAAAGSSLPRADEGVRLMRDLVADARTESGDGAAAAALIAAELVKGLCHHGTNPRRRRALVAMYEHLAAGTADALAAVAVPAVDAGRLAAAAASAACDGDVGGILTELTPAAIVELRIRPDPDGDRGLWLDREERIDLPVRLFWPDLGGAGRPVAWEDPAILVVSGEVSDASAVVRLPMDRIWLVIAERLGLPVRKMMQVHGRRHGLVLVEAQAVNGGRITAAALTALAEALGTRAAPVGRAVAAGHARRAVLDRDRIQLSVFRAAGGTGQAVTLMVARRPDETEPAYALRTDRTLRLPRVLAAARDGGLVAGGGAALRACGEAACAGAADPAAAHAFRLATAAPSTELGTAAHAGVLDPLPVVRASLAVAVRLAQRAAEAW
jgi:hypothetical protein